MCTSSPGPEEKLFWPVSGREGPSYQGASSMPCALLGAASVWPNRDAPGNMARFPSSRSLLRSSLTTLPTGRVHSRSKVGYRSLPNVARHTPSKSCSCDVHRGKTVKKDNHGGHATRLLPVTMLLYLVHRTQLSRLPSECERDRPTRGVNVAALSGILRCLPSSALFPASGGSRSKQASAKKKSSNSSIGTRP